MTNVFEELGLSLIMNQNKVSKKSVEQSQNNEHFFVEQQIKKTFQILKDEIMKNDMIVNNIDEFLTYLQKYAFYAMHKFEKDSIHKLD